MRVNAKDIKELNLLKHYRVIRKWACRNNGLNDADLELLIYFDCMDYFTKHDFEIGTYAYSWDNRRWNRLLKEGGLLCGENAIEPLRNIIYTKYPLSVNS